MSDNESSFVDPVVAIAVAEARDEIRLAQNTAAQLIDKANADREADDFYLLLHVAQTLIRRSRMCMSLLDTNVNEALHAIVCILRQPRLEAERRQHYFWLAAEAEPVPDGE